MVGYFQVLNEYQFCAFVIASNNFHDGLLNGFYYAHNHGGFGYMRDYPVCRVFLDGRVKRIYGGSNEIMKEVIARSI